MDQEISWYEDAWRRGQVRGRGRGQGNFKLAANFGYGSRGSADPRESLRKRRIGSVKKFVFLVKNGSFLVLIQI